MNRILYLDRQGCGHSNTCCSFNSPPWFNVQLPNATTDDIAILFGTDNIQTIADTPVEINLKYADEEMAAYNIHQNVQIETHTHTPANHKHTCKITHTKK